MLHRRLFCLAALGAMLTSSTALAESGHSILWGVNESGMDFGSGNIAGKNFAYPQPKYYLAHGVTLIRVPFQITRLQAQPNGPLTQPVVDEIMKIIDQNQASGAVTVLDPHEYGFYKINNNPQDLLKNEEAAADYVDFMRRLAETFGQKNIAIGLMNEPHTGSDADYAVLWNRAIAAIRQTGFRGVILVPHAHWSNASDLTPEHPYEGHIIDSGHNWVLEVHSYMDPDGSGTYKQPVVSEDIGVKRLEGAIAWARQSKTRLFLGEIGAPDTPTGLAALQNTFDIIKAAPDVFWGVAMWGGGAWWKPDYPLRLDPVDGTDRPQFMLFKKAMTGD